GTGPDRCVGAQVAVLLRPAAVAGHAFDACTAGAAAGDAGRARRWPDPWTQPRRTCRHDRLDPPMGITLPGKIPGRGAAGAPPGRQLPGHGRRRAEHPAIGTEAISCWRRPANLSTLPVPAS